jgi:hypothetical protein
MHYHPGSFRSAAAGSVSFAIHPQHELTSITHAPTIGGANQRIHLPDLAGRDDVGFDPEVLPPDPHAHPGVKGVGGGPAGFVLPFSTYGSGPGSVGVTRIRYIRINNSGSQGSIIYDAANTEELATLAAGNIGVWCGFYDPADTSWKTLHAFPEADWTVSS